MAARPPAYTWFFETLSRRPTRAEPAASHPISSPTLQKLDTETRHLLHLKYDQNRSVREIALELNLSEKAVESRLTRARQKLRKLLKP